MWSVEQHGAVNVVPLETWLWLVLYLTFPSEGAVVVHTIVAELDVMPVACGVYIDKTLEGWVLLSAVGRFWVVVAAGAGSVWAAGRFWVVVAAGAGLVSLL